MTVFDLPVHPVAALFPRLDGDELQALAADIKANGLQQPLVVGEYANEPALIDGVNRRDACRIAGIMPDTVSLNGADPVAYILGANMRRRHLSKGQQAMIMAQLFATNNLTQEQAAITVDVSQSRIAYASIVVEHASDLIDEVVNGTLSLDEAYKDATARKKTKQSRNQSLAELRKLAPDLADRVADGHDKLTLEEARILLADRDAAENNKRETLVRLSEAFYRGAMAWAADDFVVDITDRLEDESFQKLLAERLRLDPTTIGDIPKGTKALSVVLSRITKGGKSRV